MLSYERPQLGHPHLRLWMSRWWVCCMCWLVMVCLICLGCPSRFHPMLLPEEKRGGGLGCCVQGPACYTLMTEPTCTAQMGCTWNMTTMMCDSMFHYDDSDTDFQVSSKPQKLRVESWGCSHVRGLSWDIPT